MPPVTAGYNGLNFIRQQQDERKFHGLSRGLSGSLPYLSRFHDDPVLRKRDLAHLALHSLFLAEEIPEHNLPAFGMDMVHRFKDKVLAVLVPYIRLEIAHALPPQILSNKLFRTGPSTGNRGL